MIERIKSLQKYIGVYQSIGGDSLTRSELVKRMEQYYGRSAINDKSRECMEGIVPMIIVKDDKASIDYESFRSLVEGLCKLFGTDAAVLFTGPAPAPGGRKGDNPQIATVPNKAENPQFTLEKKKNTELKKQIAELQAELEKMKQQKLETTTESILASLEKSVDLSTVRVIGEPVAEDVFLHSSADIFGKCTDVSKVGGKRPSFYVEDKDDAHNLTVQNARNRFARFLFSSKFFEKLFKDSSAYEKKVAGKKDITVEEMNSNRRKSVEMLLADQTLSNGAKLALYAGWHEYHGTEMEDLLNFAGDHCLDANFVIRLLEKPDAANNYQNVRGFLRQACKASEVKLKREAAKELIAGEWYVIADYNGKPCRFQMFPVDELLLFEKELREGLHPKALAELNKLLGTYRKSAFVDADPEKELVVRSAGFQDLDSEYYAEASKMIHQYEEEHQIDANVPIDEDSTSDDFKEFEVKDNGKQ